MAKRLSLIYEQKQSQKILPVRLTNIGALKILLLMLSIIFSSVKTIYFVNIFITYISNIIANLFQILFLFNKIHLNNIGFDINFYIYIYIY